MIKNAMVVMFDSLQFDYLGCYGNNWIKTPNFDRFAEEGVLFENCYIEGLPTVPCRRAMHTGRYTLPRAGWVPLSMEDTTIADLCWGRPIDTALVFDCPNYRLIKFGYTRGFDKVWFTHGHEADHTYFYGDPLLHANPRDYIEDHILETADKVLGEKVVEPLLEEMECYLKQAQYWKSDEDRYVAKTIKQAVQYLEQADRNKQFFLWVDSFDPHEPWNPPSVFLNFPCPYDPGYQDKDQFLPLMSQVKDVYTEEEMHHIRMLYAEQVSVCDKWFGYLMDAVRRLGFEENTLVMQVSDHGEPFGNGEHGHGIMRKIRPWPYEELVHAPMMMRGPGLPTGKRVKGFVQSVDVAPTVCDWLGIGVHPDMQGKSLLPLASGAVDKVRDFAIAGYYKFSWSIITEDWTYIHWLRKTNAQEKNSSLMYELYVESIYEALGNITTSTGDERYEALRDSDKAKSGQVATLDGEDQWTCTPGASSETPEHDELYNRRADPRQLDNIADKHPEVCRELLTKLRAFMSELRSA